MKANPNYEDQYQQSIKCREMPFNQEETLKVENSAVYKRYKQWLKDHGVLMDPRVRYPSYFGQSGRGVVGVSVSKAVEKRRAIIAVPYELLITVDKVKEDLDLFQIVKENVNYFKGDDDAAMKLLILYLSSELIKGEKSIYYPYFCISSQEYLKGWDSKCLHMLQNRGLMKAITEQKQSIELEFMHFLRIYRRYENIFPQKISNNEYKDIFQKAYIFIMTRAFGWSLPSISLIPLADSFNHSNIRYVNHFLVNIDEEKAKVSEKMTTDRGYKQYKKEVNLNILKDQQLNLTEAELEELRKEKKSKALKFVQKHKDILIQSQKLAGKNTDKLQINAKNKVELRNKQNHILYQQYRAGIHKLSNLHFYESSCDQDNDTDQDQLFDKELARQKFSLYDKERSVNENTKKRQIKKLWKLYQTESEQEQDEDEEEQVPKQTASQAEKQKLKQQIKQKMLKENESSQISYDDSEDEEDPVWDWVSQANHKKSYFIMSTKGIVRQNEQIYNFYGRRSNKFLLSNYNFILKDNIYDSYPLSIKLDEKITTKVAPSKLLLFSKKEENQVRSKELKLKRYLINVELINLCRSYIILWTKKQWNNCKLTIPFDREIQAKTLEFYQEIIRYFLKQYSTSIEEDQELEQEEKLRYEQRVSITFRKQYKKILKGQDILINKALAFLKKWTIKDVQKFQENDMKWVRRLKPYLVTLQSAVNL